MSIQFSPNNIKHLLEKSALSANKNLGQNFLHDSNIIGKIIEAGEINNKDIILEIGPGLGAITIPLSEKAKKVIAIEKDGKIAEYLEKTLKEKDIQNVQIIKGDILKILTDKTDSISFSLPLNYKVIANIPYYLTSRLIRLLLEKEVLPEMIILMIQKEVAERICSKTDNSILSISIAYYAETKIKHIVSRNCFHPKPKIDSAIISIVPKKQKLEKKFTSTFFKLLKTGFGSPRKQLLKNLSELGDKEAMRKIIESSGLRPEQRAETLSLENWKALTTIYLEQSQNI